MGFQEWRDAWSGDDLSGHSLPVFTRRLLLAICVMALLSLGLGGLLGSYLGLPGWLRGVIAVLVAVATALELRGWVEGGTLPRWTRHLGWINRVLR